MIFRIALFTIFFWVIGVPGFTGRLPDFKTDATNTVKDFETSPVRPLEPGMNVGTNKTWQYASPTVVDWNGDGLFDLLVGYNLKTSANNPVIDSLQLVVYINQGSVGNPKFTGRPSDTTCFFVQIKYPGQNFLRNFTALGAHPTPNSSYVYPNVDWHTWLGFVPSIFDWNHDGLFDIFITIGACDPNCGIRQVVTCTEIWDKPGNWLLINTGTPGHPRFEKAANLNISPYNAGITGFELSTQEFAGLGVFRSMSCDGNFPQATLVDWNSDGIMDIQYAVGWANVVYGKKDSIGRWAPLQAVWSPKQNPVPVGTYYFGHHPILRTVDFNNDGVNELLVSSSQYGELHLYERLADSAGNVRYGRDTLLYKVTDGRWHHKFDVADYDEDGDLDVLCGWGRGTTAGRGLWLYRTPGGTAGSNPFVRAEKGGVQTRILSVSSFPNPSRGGLNLRWNTRGTDGPATVKVFDVRGRQIALFSPTSDAGSAHLRLSNSGNRGLSSTGLYFIRLTAQGRSITVQHLNLD